ncbi:hypothetical protein CKAN_00414800 [Cinnamomum micranthum f. kanehirae]|uniref:Uncharacterized protein n=1 Tax=Cinnamomum micranthum f. kanehirae TaxID=337451 RepID=A0A443NB45_9MAGN|nr:hypothetical protein CKAN_00414800 [Cinnamomum micranthum f. kanehirae]
MEMLSEKKKSCLSLAKALQWNLSNASMNLIVLRSRSDHTGNVQEKRARVYQVDMRARIRGNKGY